MPPTICVRGMSRGAPTTLHATDSGAPPCHEPRRTRAAETRLDAAKEQLVLAAQAIRAQRAARREAAKRAALSKKRTGLDDEGGAPDDTDVDEAEIRFFLPLLVPRLLREKIRSPRETMMTTTTRTRVF